MDLQSLIKNKKHSLKSCKTVLTDTSGRRYEIQDGKRTELVAGLPFVVDTKPDLRVARVLPGLFLSSQDPAVNVDILKENNIRHILSVGITLDMKLKDIQYHCCELLDLPSSDISEPIRTCISIIRDNLHENILVHCNAGVSRSATIVISYLMIMENLSFDEAYNKVKKERNCIKPNDGFVKQLRDLDISSFTYVYK